MSLQFELQCCAKDLSHPLISGFYGTRLLVTVLFFEVVLSHNSPDFLEVFQSFSLDIDCFFHSLLKDFYFLGSVTWLKKNNHLSKKKKKKKAACSSDESVLCKHRQLSKEATVTGIFWHFQSVTKIKKFFPFSLVESMKSTKDDTV